MNTQNNHLYYAHQDGKYYIKFGENKTDVSSKDTSEAQIAETQFPSSSQTQYNPFSGVTQDSSCPAPMAGNSSDSDSLALSTGSDIFIPNTLTATSYFPTPGFTSLSPSLFNSQPWINRLESYDGTGSDFAANISYSVYCKDIGKQAQERRQEDRDHHTFEHVELNDLGQYQLISENRTDGKIVDAITNAPDLLMVHCSTNRSYTTPKTKGPLYCLYSNGTFYPITNKTGEFGEPTEYTLRKTLKLFNSGFRERRDHKRDDGENLLGALMKNKRELWLPYFYGWNYCPMVNRWIWVTPGCNVFRDYLFSSSKTNPLSKRSTPLLTKDTALSPDEATMILLGSVVRNRAIISSMRYMLDTPLFFVLKGAGQALSLYELLLWGTKTDLSDMELAETPDEIAKKFRTEGDGVAVHFDWTPGYKLNKLMSYCQQQMEAVATSQNHTVFPFIWGKTPVPDKYTEYFIQVVVDANAFSRLTSETVLALIPHENELSLVFDKAEAYISGTEHSPFGQSLIAAAICCYPRLKEMNRLDYFQTLLNTASDLDKKHLTRA